MYFSWHNFCVKRKLYFLGAGRLKMFEHLEQESPNKISEKAL